MSDMQIIIIKSLIIIFMIKIKGAESQDLAPFLCVIASPRLETWQE